MNGAGSQHGADESGKAGTSTADFNFREEKNHQLFDAEFFFIVLWSENRFEIFYFCC